MLARLIAESPNVYQIAAPFEGDGLVNCYLIDAPRRALIDTGTDKRYVRRDERGRFAKPDHVGLRSGTVCALRMSGKTRALVGRGRAA